ncbi:nuclease-related domain-containing protein [Microbacterium enclense]|uniref:nuclease-related domain-containing protein n=1 Tax=Microbacterium enclense TaxID=993073 RepID=UPI003F819F03
MYGHVGGSLLEPGAGFGSARSNRVGATGEAKTAQILNELAAHENGPTVLHDLRIPGANANIDHLVVSGRDIWIIDSKVWMPGSYLSLGGKVYQAGQPGKLLARFRRTDDAGRVTYPAEKRTLPFARARLTSFLTEREAGPFHIRGCLMVIWPSSAAGRGLSVWAYRPVGAKAVNGSSLRRHLSGAKRSADPVLVSHLVGQLISAGA